MRLRVTCVFVAACLCVAVAGCSKDSEIESVLSDLDSFTKELVGKIESNPNPSVGVDEAQKFLDSRKDDLRAKIDSIKGVRGFQVSDETKKMMLERITDDVMSVSKLQIKYIGNSMKDPAFKTKLDKLVADYQALLKV